MLIKKSLFLIFSVIMIIYGSVGSVACFGSIPFVRSYQADIDEDSLAYSVESEFKAMSQTMQDASVAATHAATSIRNAKQFLNTGATLTESTGSSLYTISDYVGFEVLGWS
ncbi:hypothetical protein KY339_03340, partial [Candidatus Woesearchaeota archaeon]|nr:hypothetical protein [Candidatus Woesearchaeota archaeon]